MSTKLVRLKPYNPKRGCVIRRYTVYGFRFEETRGWYEVSGTVAAYLETIHQIPTDENSPKAFDVCSPKEAQVVENAERKATDEKARASEPNLAASPRVMSGSGDLTTADLRHEPEPEPEPETKPEKSEPKLEKTSPDPKPRSSKKKSGGRS